MSNLKKAISIVLAVLMVASVSPLSMAYVTFPNGDPYVAGTDYVYSDASAVTNPTPITVDTYGTTETIRIANKDQPIFDYKDESGVRTSYVVRANDAGIAETSGTFANFAYGYLSGVAQSAPFNPVIKLRINGISSTDPISGLAVSCDGLTGSVGTPTSTTGSNYVEFTWTVPTSMYTTFNSSGTGEGRVIWTINFIYAKRAYVAHAYSAKKYVVRPNGMLRVGKWDPGQTDRDKMFAHVTQLLCAQSIPGFASTSGGDHSYFDYTVNNLSGNALSGGGFDDIGNGSVIVNNWDLGGLAWFKTNYNDDDWDTWDSGWFSRNPDNAEAQYRPKSLNGDAPRTKIYIDTAYDHLGTGTANGKTNGLNLRLDWKTTDKGGNFPQRVTFMEAIKVRADGNLGSNLGGSTQSCGSAAAGTMSVNLSNVYHDGSNFNNLSAISSKGRKSDGTGGYVNADGDTIGSNYVLHSFSGTGALTNNTTWSIDYLIKSTDNTTVNDDSWLKSTNTLQVTFLTYTTATLRSVLNAIDNGTGFTYNNSTYPGKGKFPQSWMYTEGWSAFETAYDAARSVIAKFNVTQSDINTALTNLVSAYNGLQGYTPTGTITVRHCLVNTTTELVPAQTFTRATTWGNQNNSSYAAISNGASFSISGLVNSSNQCTLRGYKFVGPSNIRGSATFTPTGTVLTDEYDTNLGSEIIFYYEPATVKLKVATGIYDVGHEDATGQQFVYNADVRTGDDLNAAATVNDLAEIKAYIESHYTHPAYTVYGGMYDNSSYSGQNIDGINLAGGLTSWKMPPQDTNAYIKWNAKPVKLRINTTYGTVYTDLAAVQTPAILDDHTYEMGTVTFDLTSFNHPSSDGYDFVNYYKEAAYTNVAGNTITASYDNSEEYRIVVDGTSDYNYVDIYAKYVNLSSKIVFDPQGGTIADNTAVGSYTVVNNELSYSGATLPVSIGYPIPVRPGYVFKGWALQDGTPISGWTTYDATTGYAPVANGTHSMTSTTGLVAYAQWTPGQIMMTFQLGFDPNTESYTMNSKNLENEDFYFRTQVLADQDVDRTQFPSDPRRYGYVFNYWSYEGRRFNQAKYPTSDFTLLASWKAATDTAFGELISYVNIGGEDQIADIQHKNSNKLNPIAKKGDTVKVRFEVGGLFYAGSSSWIFAYDADVFEQVTGVTARANSNNAYINGIKAQIFEVNGAAAFNAYDDDMDKVGGKVVDPRDGSQINNPGYIQVTLDPDVNSMTNGYKTVSFDDVETYMIELILKIRTDTTKTSGSIWMPTELARSADNIMGDTYIAYSANEAALTNVETDVVKFDAEPVSTVKLVPEERPDTAITLALPTEGGVKLGEFVDTSADPEKRSTADKTFYGPEGTEILSTFTTDDTNYYETYTGNGTPWNVVGFPEPVRTGYHITAWNKTSGSGTAETWDSYNFASADQNGNTYTASWEADSHTIYFYNDPECTNLRGEVAAVYDQTGITPVVYQSGAITEFIGWIHQGDPCDAEHVLPSTYFETYTVTGDDSFYAYTKNARKTVSLVGYNDSTNANIGTVSLTEAVQDALGIELRVGDTLSIVNEIPANPASGYYYITKETADTLLRGEYTYESGGSTVTVNSSMGSTAKNFYAIKDITTPVNLAIAAAGDNEIRVAYRPLDFTVYFKSAPASGNFAPVVDGAAAHPGYNGGFGETLVTDPDTGILTWSITGPYNTTYDFDIASAGLVAPFGWKFQNYTPGTNRGTFRATGTNTSMTYTAQWSPASVTVHWLSEDFSEVKTATCNYNANYNVYTNAPSMTKDGYQFMGWKHAIVSGNTYTAAGDLITASANSIYNCSTSPEGTTYVVGTGVGTVASESDYIGLGTDATYDIYYLPVFQINQYNIIYNTIYTDGKYNPDPFGIGYDYGSTVTEFATVSDVTGYTFDGWYDESVYADKTNVITSKTIGAENINVYGYFTPNNYTVNFDPNGGTGDVQGVTVAYNAQITAPATAPTRTGYELLGWAETNDATEALATLPELTEAAASIGGVAKTLYAVWGINQYTISYDANGGTLTDEATATFDYNAAITNPTAPTRTGYDFAGWAYSNADTHEAYTGSTMPAFNLDAQAQWNIKSYEVTFDTDGGSANTTSTFEYGATIVPPADPTKTGYTFAGWSGIPADGKMPAEDITVIATWTANVYTINYSTDGTAVAADVLTYGTDSVPAKTGKVTTKDGYDFEFNLVGSFDRLDT
ncbi:MAG: InlB B-repeat-containing protein, partial [Clostridia bacterium]|nr:InlB B-repeat-containing protein [Clostridia bacterium]